MAADGAQAASSRAATSWATDGSSVVRTGAAKPGVTLIARTALSHSNPPGSLDRATRTMDRKSAHPAAAAAVPPPSRADGTSVRASLNTPPAAVLHAASEAASNGLPPRSDPRPSRRNSVVATVPSPSSLAAARPSLRTRAPHGATKQAIPAQRHAAAKARLNGTGRSRSHAETGRDGSTWAMVFPH